MAVLAVAKRRCQICCVCNDGDLHVELLAAEERCDEMFPIQQQCHLLSLSTHGGGSWRRRGTINGDEGGNMVNGEKGADRWRSDDYAIALDERKRGPSNM